MLIALLGLSVMHASASGVALVAAQVLLGSGWARFPHPHCPAASIHLMVLPIVYIAMAEEHH
ncbi:MAG: hypothetical protein WDM77_01570 [Steroidobacteraceae bacterium]